MEEQKHISEEQIKALIQKYEEKVKDAESKQSKELDKPTFNQDDVFLQSMQMDILNYGAVISDLKQLLTN